MRGIIKQLMDETLIALRRDYTAATLDIADVLPDPIAQFGLWIKQAMASQVLDVEAMTLATASADGTPSARIVLLRGYDQRGFTFYTNYESQKGSDLAANAACAVVFHWREIERQVRIQGDAQKVTAEESEAYFATRPRGSQLGAWVSRQSTVLKNREELEKEWNTLDSKYKGTGIDRPPFWGGYRVVPKCIEFWQGRRSRLHDRLQYSLTDAGWKLDRLAP